MHHPIPLDEENRLTLETSFRNYKVHLNGEEIRPVKTKIGGTSEYMFKTPDENKHHLIIKTNTWDPHVKTAILNGKEIQVTKKLEWYEYLVIFAPMLFFILGGFIGVILGLLSVGINTWLMRILNIHPALKILVAVGVAFVFSIIYLFIAGAIFLL